MRKLTHEEISQKRCSLHTIEKADKMPVAVLLDSIRSAYNVGSIFRTSDGAMIEQLILSGYTPSPEENQDVKKTALSSDLSVKWVKVKSPVEIIKSLKDKGYKIAALELTDNSKLYYNLEIKDFPLCLIIGNEIKGVSEECLRLCDFSLEIPQYGIKQSLNVAVAYGIAIFEIRKFYDLILKKASVNAP